MGPSTSGNSYSVGKEVHLHGRGQTSHRSPLTLPKVRGEAGNPPVGTRKWSLGENLWYTPTPNETIR